MPELAGESEKPSFLVDRDKRDEAAAAAEVARRAQPVQRGQVQEVPTGFRLSRRPVDRPEAPPPLPYDTPNERVVDEAPAPEPVAAEPPAGPAGAARAADRDDPPGRAAGIDACPAVDLSSREPSSAAYASGAAGNRAPRRLTRGFYALRARGGRIGHSPVPVVSGAARAVDSGAQARRAPRPAGAAAPAPARRAP